MSNMNNLKRLVALGLVLCMTFAFAACGQKEEPAQNAANTTTETKTEETKTEETKEPEKTAEELEQEAWEKEPAYGTTLKYWIGGSCTSATNLADHLGYFADEGLTVEGFKGESDVEAIGTNMAQIAIGHIAKATVPATNGVNLTFVGSAHLLKGCKSLYVLADSEYQYYEDLKGCSISVPNGIGASDYNITSRLLLEAGMNPLEDVTLTPVDQDACVAAMQNGQIQAALLGDPFAYQMVQDGTLRRIDSKDGNSTDELCCIIMMNRDFIAENPITATKMANAVKRALKYEGEHTEEATKTLMELGLNPKDKYDMNLDLNQQMEFGQQSDEYTAAQLHSIVEDYIKVGLITAETDADAVVEHL